MIKKKGNVTKLLLGLAILLFLMCDSAWAEVTLFAEGAYSGQELKVYVYVNSNENLVSFGVKIAYDPEELTLDESTCLERNNSVWYFGDPAEPYATPNAGPNVDSTEGSVTFVGGKIDSIDPKTGVAAADRILLGIVTFTSKNGNDITSAPYVEVALGKDGDYANFVGISGDMLDSEISVTTNCEIYERGDANGDGEFSSSDMFKIRGALSDGEYKCYMDCNGDGELSSSDMFCVREKI